MKRRVYILLLVCMLIPSLALAKSKAKDESIPEQVLSHFELCGVQNEKELFDMAIKYMSIPESEYAERYAKQRQNDPIKVRYGATTKDMKNNVEDLVREAIMDARPAELVRNLEGINRVKYWTIDQLIEKQEN